MLRTHEKSAFGYGLLNMCTGPFCIGSIIQGDPMGLVVAGLNAGMLLLGTTGNSNPQGNGFIGVVVETWVVSWFLPTIYSGGYNSKLEKALNLHGISSVSLSPYMNPLANGTPSAGVMLGVGF
ncbi:MAG: hypothetical protein ACKOE4_02875 [Candidatus Kapaibacterium sp.]